MELDTVDGEGFVLQAHDFAFGGFRGDFQDVGQGFAFDDEGVIARGLEGRGEIFEDASARVENGRGFAVHEAVGPDHVASVDFADALVTETDAEDRNASSESLYNFAADAGFGWGAGSGGDDDSLRRELFDLRYGDLVVAHDMEVRPQLAEILDEVVGEAVVVIEDEDHDGSTVRARSMARMTPMALLMVS